MRRGFRVKVSWRSTESTNVPAIDYVVAKLKGLRQRFTQDDSPQRNSAGTLTVTSAEYR